MTIKQLGTYFENEDSTSVKVKSFHRSTENTYPDFSFCVSGNGSNQFNESRLPNNVNSVDLANMLNGNESNDLEKNVAMR